MKKTLNKLITNEKGQALPIVLILLLLGGLLIGPLLGYMSTGLMAGQVYEGKMGGLYAADAGIEDALWKLMNDPPATYPDSYTLTDVNGMSVSVDITEVTVLFGEEVGEGGTHDYYLGLESELVQPAYYDAGENATIHEWRLKLTNKTNSPVKIYSITISYSNELEYLSGLYDDNVTGLKSGSFESFTTDFTYKSNVTLLTWEYSPPRPEIESAPDHEGEPPVYTTVSTTFKLKGPEEAEGIAAYLVMSRQDVGTVWEFKPFQITAQADDGSTVTTVTARVLSAGSTVLVSYWQIEY